MTLRDLMIFTIGFGTCWSLMHRPQYQKVILQFTHPRRPWPVAEGMN